MSLTAEESKALAAADQIITEGFNQRCLTKEQKEELKNLYHAYPAIADCLIDNLQILKEMCG